MPKSSILVSSDHNNFTQVSSESLAHFRRACTCAFLSRGSLRAVQDFSPSRGSVLPIVFWLLWSQTIWSYCQWYQGSCYYGHSYLDIIDNILPCSGLIPHRSHDHWDSTRWDLAWSPSARDIYSYFVLLPFASNHTTVVSFSPSCLAMVL